MGSLIPLIAGRLISTDKDEQGNPVKIIKNQNESYISFNIKILKEIVFYCKDQVRENLEDILLII